MKKSSKLQLQELIDILWRAANIFRRSVNISNFRQQFLGLIFIKRLSDSFDEVQDEIIQWYINKGESEEVAISKSEAPDEYVGRFFVPQIARWSELEKMRGISDIGKHLNEVCFNIEQEIPELSGVLTSIDYFSEDERQNDMWRSLISYLAPFSFSDEYLERPNLFGLSFESLLERFADEAGKKGGEFYTPKAVTRLMVELLNPQDNMKIYDPTCGAGGFLVQTFNYLVDKRKPTEKVTFYGQELNRNTWALCKMNLFLHNACREDIRIGDTLAEPEHSDDKNVEKFDRVFANPPYNLKIPDHWSYEEDKYYRFSYGFPPRNSADFGFLQHMIASLKDDGQAAVILPVGVLFRGNGERTIREGILKDDLIEAIIGLPPGLFYGTSIPTCVIILNKNKALDRKEKVLFIDASQDFLPTNAMNVLRDEDIQAIVNSFSNFESSNTFSKVVTVDEILSKDVDLNITLYVNNSPVLQEIDVLLEHHAGFEQISLTDPKLVESIGIFKPGKELDISNSIYLRRRQPELDLVLTQTVGQKLSSAGYVRVSFRKEKLLSEYAKLFFESQLGRKMLSQIPTGKSIQLLQTKSVQSLSIPIPTIDVQLEVIKVASKLEIAREQIDQFFKKLTTEPKKYKSIEDSTDEMVYRLSALSDVKHLQHLISLGETRQMEFKQSFFANVDKIRNETVNVEKDRDAQGEIIKDIVSFLNTTGGILLIGVNDKGKVTGVDIERKRFGFKKMDNYFQELGAQLASRIRADYAEYCQLTEVPFEGKTIVRIDCQPSPTPIFLDNTKFHVRTDTSSPELTGIEMLRYIQNHFKVALINDPENHSPTA